MDRRQMILEYLHNAIEEHAGMKIWVSHLWWHYTHWQEDRGLPYESASFFRKVVREAGLQTIRSKGSLYYADVWFKEGVSA